jgi:hypothetical protein
VRVAAEATTVRSSEPTTRSGEGMTSPRPCRRARRLSGHIALGHPLGASGAILMTRLVHHLRDHGLRYGLQTMCEGGGTANVTLVELLDV